MRIFCAGQERLLHRVLKKFPVRNHVILKNLSHPSQHNAPSYQPELRVAKAQLFGTICDHHKALRGREAFAASVRSFRWITALANFQSCSSSLLVKYAHWRSFVRYGDGSSGRIGSCRARTLSQSCIARWKDYCSFSQKSCLVGGIFLFRNSPEPAAEQLHGKAVINSRDPLRLSIRVRTFGCISKTVESILLLSRAIYLLVLFTPALVLAPFVDHLGGRVRGLWLQILLSTLEKAGPAFIKWAQWAATRPDIFPQDVCDWLAKLHMQAPSHSFEKTRQICEKAFGLKLEDIFEEITEEPVASGSIAQVHRATLKNRAGKGIPGQVVALKVRHPRVTKIIQRDFVIIKWLANFSTVLPGLKHLQLDKTVQQFASFMTQQVDLTLEAAHLVRFIYNFRRSRDVHFPVPIYPWVHPAVLVETYEEGQSIANFVDLTTDVTPTHTRLAYLGSSTLLKMLLKDNFIHGDLHPGNIFVRFKNSRPNVVLLDVGMTAELNHRSREILIKLFEAVARTNGMDVAKWTLQFSELQTCPDPEAFTRDVDSKFKEYLSIRGTMKNTGECMTDLFDQIRRHKVSIDGDVCTVMVTTMILEGWQRKLDPDLDVITMVGDLLLKQRWLVPYDYVITAVVAP